MKRTWAWGLVGLVAVWTGCSSTQPTQRGTANVVIELRTTGTAFGAFLYNKRVGGPDQPTQVKAQCDPAIVNQEQVLLQGSILPMPLAVEISVFRAGEPIQTADGAPVPTIIGKTEGYTTITGYDAASLPPVAVPSKPPNTSTNVPVYYTDGRFVSSASREYFERCPDIIPYPVPDPSVYQPVQVLFQTINSPTYTLALGQGDTIVVKVQKPREDSTAYAIGRNALVSAKLFVDGIVKVTAQSSGLNQSGIVMTYTLQ